jgi:hypothetical protein
MPVNHAAVTQTVVELVFTRIIRVLKIRERRSRVFVLQTITILDVERWSKRVVFSVQYAWTNTGNGKSPLLMMQNSLIWHQTKNDRKLRVSTMQKADAPEMPVQWSVFEGVPPKRKVRFPPNVRHPAGRLG